LPPRYLYEALQELDVKPQVVTLNPHTIEDVLVDIMRVGEATGCPDRAQALVNELASQIESIRTQNTSGDKTVVCLEWLQPLYNSGHWVPQLIEYAGGRELLGEKTKPSRRITWEQLVDADPEHLFLTVCGYDVPRTLRELVVLSKREEWHHLRSVRLGNIYAMNASWYFSRPGPRLIEGLRAAANFLKAKPDSVPENVGVRVSGRLFKTT
jgi:iron complex transport system substrate-binding protein